jgi:hypothetical protein
VSLVYTFPSPLQPRTVQSPFYFQMSLKSHSLATCFGLTRPSSGSYSPINLTSCSVTIKSALGCSYHVDVGNIADGSQVHAATIFRVEVFRVCEFPCIYGLFRVKAQGEEGATDTPSGPARTVHQ